MINALMFGALGFFLGCLLALMIAPPLWNRAVKLTTRKLEATMPMSLNDIQADKDQLRAEFAIELRKVEVALDKAKEKAIRELIEANKRRVEIAMLNTDLATVKAQLQENENANRVLQQTIKRRLPDLDTRLKAAKKALAELEQVNGELRATVASQSDALKTARTTLHNQRSDIERLRMALEAGGAGGLRGGKADARTLAESQRLTAELSKAQEQLERARTSAEENMLLRRELSKLASQILAVARTQGVAQVQQRMVVEVAQAYVEPQRDQRPASAPRRERGPSLASRTCRKRRRARAGDGRDRARIGRHGPLGGQCRGAGRRGGRGHRQRSRGGERLACQTLRRTPGGAPRTQDRRQPERPAERPRRRAPRQLTAADLQV